MAERILASIQEIGGKSDIPDANLIEVVQINGWEVVGKKGEFEVGDKCIYFEIDSFLPVEEEYEFLRKCCFKRTSNLGDGFRLRTIKLRGQISQGLVLPLTGRFSQYSGLEVGTDLTEILGIKKYEAPVPTQLAGQVKGTFPNFIPKTDEPRIQNLSKKIDAWFDARELFEVTIKLDGTSCTVYYRDGEVGICSRNMELKDNEENIDNLYIMVAKTSGLVDALKSYGKNIAVQGEIVGPGIQKNYERISHHTLFVFNIFDIDRGKYLDPESRRRMFVELVSIHGFTGQHVPIIEYNSQLPSSTVKGILCYAEGPSINNPVREGVVFKSNTNPNISFKAISNKYLINEE